MHASPIHRAGGGCDCLLPIVFVRPSPADINGDGFVDVSDLLVVLAVLAVLVAWGNTSGPEDVNGDGIVDVLDMLEVLAAWGSCP